MSTRQLLDRKSREERLSTKITAPLGSLLDLEEKGFEFVAVSGSSDVKRRALEMQTAQCRIQNRARDEDSSAPLEHALHMLKSLCSGGFSAQEYFASQGIDGSQLAPRKAFVAMLRNLLPVNDKEIAAILTRYGESGAVDTKTFFADAGLSPSFQASAESHSDDISSSVLHQLRRQIVSNSKGPEHVMRLFATYDRLGTGTATTVQFVRVLRRVQITLPESDEDAITQALDGSQTGKIDYLSFVRFCFEDKGAKLSSSGPKSPAAHKPGRPQSALVTRPVLLEEGGSGVREVVRPNRPSSSTARLNSSLRRRSSDSAYDDYRHEVFDDDQALHPAPRSPLMAHLDEYSDIQEDGGSVASNISLVASNTIDNSSYRSVVPPDRSSSSASSVTSSLQWYTDPLLQDPSKDADITAPYLLRLRELVVRRHQQGRSLREIFHHFDRAKSGYFGAAELRRGMNDLKLNVNADLVPAVLRSIAMDGADRASLGEFTAFMSGCDFKAVEDRVVECVSRHVRGAGLAFLQRFLDAMGASYTSPELFPPLSDVGHGMDRSTFIETLRRLGLTLQKDDVDSLCTRFDLHASGVISVARFLKMVQASTGFVEAERGAMEQEEVCQQAAQAKRVLRAKASTGQTFLTLDIIQMAEYLGIKCISEPQLLWIAKQCLQAPLPPNWSSRIDTSGSTVYCNSATRKAQAEHPLDPHFKALRDAYRARSTSSENAGGQSGAYSAGAFGIERVQPFQFRAPPAYDYSLWPPSLEKPEPTRFSSQMHFADTAKIYSERPASAVASPSGGLRGHRAQSAGRVRRRTPQRQNRQSLAANDLPIVAMEHVPHPTRPGPGGIVIL